MFDAYTEQRQKMLREWAEYVDSIEDRIACAKEALGERYLMHPANRVQRRAKPYGSAK